MRITPLRFTTLQCSQSFLTDARTFIFKFISRLRTRYNPCSGRTANISPSLGRRYSNGRNSSAFGPRYAPGVDVHSAVPLGTARSAVFPLPSLQGQWPLLQARQNLRLIFGDQHRMLKMSGRHPVLRYD